MEYKSMEPPFKVIDFKEMTKKDASQHYEWFIGQIDKRIGLLESALNIFHAKFELDYSKESLINLWEWFIKNAEFELKTSDELLNEQKKINPIFNIQLQPNKINMGWKMIAMDIGIYFSECFRRKYENTKWGIITSPKSLAYVNKPVLIGFKNGMALDSLNILNMQSLKIINNTADKNDLVIIFNNWAQFI